jgi:hypothetical protein
MKIVLVGLVILVVAFAVIYLVGTRLPVEHTASRSATLAASPEQVWPALVDRSWRKGGRHDDIPFEIVTSEPPRRLITRIADKTLPFGGEWEYDIAPAGADSSRVTITERGEVYNPVFRFLSRFVFGYHATMDGFLQDLAAHVGGGPHGT